jgi:hypothetical protein
MEIASLCELKTEEGKWRLFFEDLFSRFFGKRHFSLECVIRSCLLSIALIGAVYGIILIKAPWVRGFTIAGFGIVVIPFFVVGCIVNYLSLWKTRYLLTRREAFEKGSAALAIVAGDVVLPTVVFVVAYSVGMGVYYFLLTRMSLLESINWWFHNSLLFLNPSDPGGTGFLYLAALTTSAWLWIYLTVAYGMRAIGKAPVGLKVLSTVTDFDNHPVRSIGYVAATVSAAIAAIISLV